MAIDLNGLVSVTGAAENNAGSKVNGLNSQSTMDQVQQAQLAMTQYQLVATAVTSIISADAEMKKNGARAINGG